MDYSRRPDERRRRVMMTTGASAPAVATASSRKRMEQLREARRPQVAYGSRVRKCLRGRWFSLVPVDRTMFVKFLTGLALLVGVLTFLHYASVRYPTIANQPSWVDVLRINRYGSFGRYAIGVLYLLVAGAAWLIYQLRRYRNDDFSGNYQLWQWIVASALVASVASTVPLLAMLGAVIDWSLGQRAALSGEDWIELFLIVGGAILSLRTIAEMWRYRWSTGFMLAGWLAMAIPTAAEWNVIDVEDLPRWTVVTSAPLIAVACWLAATVGYLRCLFREVRGIEPAVGLMQRLRVVAEDWTPGSAESSAELSSQDAPSASPPAKRKVPAATAARAEPKRPASQAQPEPARIDEPSEEPPGDGDQSVEKTSRSWWPFGRSKASDQSERVKEADATNNIIEESDASIEEDLEDQPEAKRRKWWPNFKRKEKIDSDGEAVGNDEADDVSEPEPTDDSSEAPVKKRRFGLGSIMKRRSTPAAEDASDVDESSEESDSPSDQSQQTSVDDKVDAQVSDDDIDWQSMNKAERRRMRKQLKRGGKAA